jgi:hypothetical protein
MPPHIFCSAPQINSTVFALGLGEFIHAANERQALRQFNLGQLAWVEMMYELGEQKVPSNEGLVDFLFPPEGRQTAVRAAATPGEHCAAGADAGAGAGAGAADPQVAAGAGMPVAADAAGAAEEYEVEYMDHDEL